MTTSTFVSKPLFEVGAFTLHSGASTFWRFNEEALTDEELAALAQMLAVMVGPFQSVEGVPRGGLRLARALWRWATDPVPPAVRYHLVVDDVWTTGASLTAAIDAAVEARPESCVIGGVILQRGPRTGSYAAAVTRALFTFTGEAFPT